MKIYREKNDLVVLKAGIAEVVTKG